MIRLARRKRVAVASGLAALTLVTTLLVADIGGFGSAWRERAFDAILVWQPRRSAAVQPRVVVVDIDRDSLAEIGPWPWRRSRMARLVEAIAQHAPAAIAIDVLLTDRNDTEGDMALAAALRLVPGVLSAVLDPDRAAPALWRTPLIVAEPRPVLAPLVAAGLSGPTPALVAASRALGMASLPAPDGEPVRVAPLLAFVGDDVVAGFAYEAARVGLGDGMAIVGGTPATLRLADRVNALPQDAALRLHFDEAAARAARTLPARSLFPSEAARKPALAARFAGAIVLIGSSAPEAGGLRRTAVDPFFPTVHIHANAVEQLLSGDAPWRPHAAQPIEIAGILALGSAVVAAAVWLSPLAGGAVTLALSAFWIAASVAAFRGFGALLDPVAPVLTAGVAFQSAAFAAFVVARGERAAIVRRFSQHLAPQVVRRIADNPDQLRLDGETRDVTAVFTDIEGFTALAERAAPRDLILLLDRYLDSVSSIVVAHGGMVDKIVGDAVHAFFNAPVDLPEHVGQAVACARAIAQATKDLRENDPLAKALKLGRTRIGVETGPAVVGEVGGSLRLDYTAHGPAINAAAKLEAANKRFGTTILVGPGVHAALAGRISDSTGLNGARLVEAGRLALSEGGNKIVVHAVVED